MSRIDIILTENPHYDPSMAFIENITDKVDGVFSWTIEAFGGFATAHLEMIVSEVDAWTMINRIGKRIARPAIIILTGTPANAHQGSSFTPRRNCS